jgi:hypothetical protein
MKNKLRALVLAVVNVASFGRFGVPFSTALDQDCSATELAAAGLIGGAAGISGTLAVGYFMGEPEKPNTTNSFVNDVDRILANEQAIETKEKEITAEAKALSSKSAAVCKAKERANK